MTSALDRKRIAQKMRRVADENPWYLTGPPGSIYWHQLPDGLRLCFTLDMRSPQDGGPTYHLSLSRPTGPPTAEEVEAWVEAFFDSGEPVYLYPGFRPNVVHAEAPARPPVM